MTERPILFTGPNVLKVIAGRKTQTRRIVKPELDPKTHSPWLSPDGMWRWMTGVISYGDDERRCPYGVPCDRLWVREAWRLRSADRTVAYRADCAPHEDEHWRWKPSIHMPRWASRLTLEITAVSVERIHGISRADAIAEGYADEERASPTDAFHNAWNALHGDGAWQRNDWVWALTFRRLTP